MTIEALLIVAVLSAPFVWALRRQYLRLFGRRPPLPPMWDYDAWEKRLNADERGIDMDALGFNDARKGIDTSPWWAVKAEEDWIERHRNRR